ARSWLRAATYLEDSEVTVDGVRIWGSPWQPWFYDWAFNLERGPAIAAKWDRIPAGIDVLVTHGPPAGILDRTDQGDAVGCADLLAAVRRVRPKLHVFGHIHEAYGTLEQDGVRFVNASNCSVRYRPVQPPIVVDL
ncbi:MAG: metallophosphoesterase, partial [Planctomycetes bacterium]|nr:metallophosphoesterase [Planctomycetota bacterium]